MSELKCCPFCGGEVYFTTEDYNDEITHLICCDNCDLKFYGSNSYEIKDHIVNQWNTRKSMTNIVEKLEEREKYLENAMKESHENGHRFSEEKAMNERVAIRYAINIVNQEIDNERRKR